MELATTVTKIKGLHRDIGRVLTKMLCYDTRSMKYVRFKSEQKKDIVKSIAGSNYEFDDSKMIFCNESESIKMDIDMCETCGNYNLSTTFGFNSPQNIVCSCPNRITEEDWMELMDHLAQIYS
jgi:hypothetical protein